VFEFDQWTSASAPLLFGAPYSQLAIAANGSLTISGAHGESGTSSNLIAVLPSGTNVTKVLVNGKQLSSFSTGDLYGLPTVNATSAWVGTRFRRAQEIFPTHNITNITANSNGTLQWTGTFTVPQSVIDQFKALNATYVLRN
jgi:hypothetical protein